MGKPFLCLNMAKKRTKKTTIRKKKKTNYVWLVIPLLILCFGGFILYKINVFLNKQQAVAIKKEILHAIPKGFPAFGIDVSHHQGKVDWYRIFQQEGYDSIIHFVYCKATEGGDHCDTQWDYNRKTLLKLKIPHGAYHFFFLKKDPIIQAKHFLNTWKKSDYDLPPVLDVERNARTDQDLIAAMKKWLFYVEAETGMRPIIYTSSYYFDSKFQHDFKNYKFWIAAYSKKPESIEDSRIIHWQFSEKGNLPGCATRLDFNVSKISIY